VSTTTVNTNSILKKYESNYFKDYVRESGFKPYMGTSSLSPFVVKRELIDGGQVINIPLVSALNGDGKGTGTLVGNEEALGNYSYDIKPYWHRHAVLVNKDQAHISSFDVKSAARDMLKVWDMDNLRDGIIDALSAVAESSGAYDGANGHAKQVYLSEATTTQKNAFAAANQYRLLFGAAESNYSATWATALATVGAGDEFGMDEVSLMKLMARRRIRGTVPSVRPIRTGEEGREYFVIFTGSLNFKKLRADMLTVNLDGRPRDVGKNPIFQSGDLEYDGCIIREIPEIATGTTAGLSANQEPAYLCGAQALGIAWGQTPRGTERKEDDYGFQFGKGTESLWAAEKLLFNGLDHGVVSGFFYTA
jgi:hypothetical protein